MPAFTATAPGKIILFGEHAVVYGQPAIAVPVNQVKARVVIEPSPRGIPGAVHILAGDVNLDSCLDDLPLAHPLAAALRLVLAELRIDHCPACTVRIASTIPVASGLGSGAAVSVALLRAFSAFLGKPLSDEQVNALAFEVEKIHHGTPSGIDNTVITFAMPVYFVKDQAIQLFTVAQPFTFVIGDTGIFSPTSVAVGDVRRLWQADPARFQDYFAEIGRLVDQARLFIETSQPEKLGKCMQANHDLLQQLTVSCPALDQLVVAALQAGAWGAKLSGGGRGGNMIALVSPEQAEPVAEALRSAGAVRTIITQVK